MLKVKKVFSLKFKIFFLGLYWRISVFLVLMSSCDCGLFIVCIKLIVMVSCLLFGVGWSMISLLGGMVLIVLMVLVLSDEVCLIFVLVRVIVLSILRLKLWGSGCCLLGRLFFV